MKIETEKSIKHQCSCHDNSGTGTGIVDDNSNHNKIIINGQNTPRSMPPTSDEHAKLTA